MIERNILPAEPNPTRYKLSIKSNLRNNTFDGNVVISLATTAENAEVNKISAITLNAAELTFHQVSFRCAHSGQQLPISVDRITFDADNQRATIPIPAAYTHPTELTIKYSGIIQSNMTGLYKSTYMISDKKEDQKDTENEKLELAEKEEVMLVTQMCPVDARKVLPCWDEPARKAIFEVSLIAPSKMIALSNMPCISRLVRNDNTSEWHFAPTPPMSTYLLAFVMGKLSYIEQSVKKTFPVQTIVEETSQNSENHSKITNNTTNDDETNVRVYAIPGKEHNAQFALDIACAVLPMYEKFFNSNYQLPKMDMIATPNFAFGAMENWGCITYRERLLLYTNRSGAERKQDCAITVAHEIAHQWFGNLVTMEWWKELWLNESFATFIATWAIHKLHPEWEMDVNYLYTECERAFELDALRSSHPIEVDLRNAQEIDGIFDAISYSKGGSVLRMVEKYIGAEVFQRGLALYLHEHAFHNASSTDLWDALSSVHGNDLRSMLRCWTSQQGFPFLEVTLDTESETDHSTGLKLHITQSRFTLEKATKNDSNEPLWHIPLVITIGHDTVNENEKSAKSDNDAKAPGDKEHSPNVEEQPCSTNTTSLKEKISTIRHVLPPSSQSSITLPITNYSWINVNTHRTAFCRVFYRDHALLSLLLRKVQGKELDAMDRLSLVSDYHAFARGGYCRTSTVLYMLTYYVNEENSTVWKEITQFLSIVRYMLMASHSKSNDVLTCFNNFCMHLYRPVMDRIGYLKANATLDVSTTSNTTSAFADEKINKSILRSIIVQSMLSVNDPETLQKLKEMSMVKNESAVSTDLISSVCKYKLQNGGESEFEHVQREIKRTLDAGRKTMLLELLPYSNVENVVERLVDYVLSDECQGQDALSIFNSLASIPHTYIKFVHELMRRWPEIAQKLPGVMQSRALKLIGFGFDGSMGSSLRSFWSTLPETTQSSTGASFQQGMESLSINAAWAERDVLDVANFLQQWSKKH